MSHFLGKANGVSLVLILNTHCTYESFFFSLITQSVTCSDQTSALGLHTYRSRSPAFPPESSVNPPAPDNMCHHTLMEAVVCGEVGGDFNSCQKLPWRHIHLYKRQAPCYTPCCMRHLKDFTVNPIRQNAGVSTSELLW